MSDNHDITRVRATLAVTPGEELKEGNQCPICERFYKTELANNPKAGKQTCVKCLLDMNFSKVGHL